MSYLCIVSCSDRLKFQKWTSCHGISSYCDIKIKWHLIYNLAMSWLPYSPWLELATELKSFIFTSYCSSFAIPYSRKFLREKTFANWWKNMNFVEKTSWIARLCFQRMPHPQILQRKLLWIATKPRKFAKVFSLESSPLHGSLLIYQEAPRVNGSSWPLSWWWWRWSFYLHWAQTQQRVNYYRLQREVYKLYKTIWNRLEGMCHMYRIIKFFV